MGACPSVHTDRPSLNKPPHSQGGGQQTGAGGGGVGGGGGGGAGGYRTDSGMKCKITNISECFL